MKVYLIEFDQNLFFGAATRFLLSDCNLTPELFLEQVLYHWGSLAKGLDISAEMQAYDAFIDDLTDLAVREDRVRGGKDHARIVEQIDTAADSLMELATAIRASMDLTFEDFPSLLEQMAAEEEEEVVFKVSTIGPDDTFLKIGTGVR